MTLTTAGAHQRGARALPVADGARIDGLAEYAGNWKYRWR